MNYADMLSAVRHRWKLVAICFAVTVVAIGVWTLFSPRIYSSAATLLFDNSAAEGDGATGNDPAMATVLGTQADIIRSGAVASQVAKSLDLSHNPAVVARWKAETGGRGSIDSWLIGSLLGNVSAVPIRNTAVMAVQYNASDPDFAAAVANGFAEAFVNIQLRLRTEPARVYSEWFEDRTREVRARYEQAQARLTGFQQEKGLIGGEKLDVELTHLAELSSQLATAEGASADMGTRASNGASSSPDVQSSAAVVGLKGAVAAKAAEVQQLETTLGPNHPQLMTARAALSMLNSKLGEAIGTATQSLRTASVSARARENELRARLATQRSQVLKLSNVQDQLAILQRDVDAAKAAYDAVTQRMNGARLRAEIPQTSVSILDRAGPSFYPTSPNIPLRLLLAVMLGISLGAGIALLVEWFSPRVRTSVGLEQTLGLATLVDLDEHRRSRNTIIQGAAA